MPDDVPGLLTASAAPQPSDRQPLPSLSQLLQLLYGHSGAAGDLMQRLQMLGTAGMRPPFLPGSVPGAPSYQTPPMADYMPQGSAPMPRGGAITAGGYTTPQWQGPLLSQAPDAVRRLAYR